ncbi:LysR family transcriptional regulator [Enterovibrio makurazakiensis]|uniref:LysR family transcriptional regulator n=1 Tax=Enterovibrio gelatinilyticus TaxID=2899819 RepID=A0ABT5QV63_9GAMM|nr:LysR family transcriptional regulator [Enterovibrio sp. ZSDZ42]MDD1791639.1 LysR family transcriptional regulator [Enterovibrio sp. ZSDZ42]
MHITFRQIHIFQSVASHLSYTKAAEVMFLTQPAVSMQIRQLEENVGLALFEVMGKSLYLTSAGEEFMLHCNRIMQDFSDAKRAIESLKSFKSGKLKITVASTANYFSARLLASFLHIHPDIQVSLNVTNREFLINELKNNDCDLLIMGKPPADIEVNATPFIENPLVVIAPPNHPLGKEACISVQRIASESMVVRELGSGTRFAIERFFRSKDLTLNVGAEMSATEAIKQAVSAGLYLGIVSRHSIEQELETGRLIELDVADMPIIRHWYLVHRKGKKLTPIAHAFCDFLLDEANIREAIHS